MILDIVKVYTVSDDFNVVMLTLVMLSGAFLQSKNVQSKHPLPLHI